MSATNASARKSMWRAIRSDTRRDDNHHAQQFQPALPGERRSTVRPGIARLDGFLSPRTSTELDPRALPGGREYPSRTGSTDGSTVWNNRSAVDSFGPRFDRSVPDDGYAWWYLDAISDDGEHAITLIAFVGSVFSPYYASQRRHGPSTPDNHCAMNIALYGAKRRWAMTERASHALKRDANMLQIGPSSIHWDGRAFHITLDEVTMPLPSRISGTITLTPDVRNLQSFALSENTEHRWWPLVPRARIEVNLPLPSVRWSGNAYLDCNWGEGPLEQSFRRWSWSRSERADGSSEIFYDVVSREGRDVNLALRVTADGLLEHIEAPVATPLSRTRWRLDRLQRRHDSELAGRITSLEDGPFYARTLIESTTLGRTSKTVHESLCLERFASPWVQAMLPFRMPRVPALAFRAVVLMAAMRVWWLATVAPDRRVGSDQLQYHQPNANAKNRQHLDQPKVLSHGYAPWYRLDRHAEDLLELFLKLEQRDAAARQVTYQRSRV
jgi:carotenoid 1,2-hydratase